MSESTEQTDSEPSDPEQPQKLRRINPVVFFGSSVLILGIAIWAMITPDGAANTIGTAVGWISNGLGWYYFLATTLFLIFVVYIAVSRYGTVKLGPEGSSPEFGVFAWASMLFAAGIGIDLMFFSVSGPVSHYLDPPAGAPETVEAARQGVVWTLLHYGITGWAMYALMGMALGYFAFRRRLPLSIRSALYPIFGKRIHGGIGHTVDLAAVVGTIFGIAVSLGIGVVQLNYGLNFLFDIPEGIPAQIGLIVLAAFMATVSAVAGVDKGIRRLSQLNIVLATGLMAYVLVYENPVQLLNGLILNIGDYLSRFPSMTLNTFAYDRPTEWLNDWTLFFWAWWIAWAPFVGIFLARISRGRTIRQFVAATLIVPFLFTASFLSIFGNSALSIVRGGNAEFGETAMNVPEQGFYTMLAEYPAVTFSAGLATFVGLLFYVTSADSGALVMGNFTSRLATPTTDASRWVRTFWASATGVITLAMLLVDGVDALQNATIIMGLPFSVVIFAVMLGLYRALQAEKFAKDVFDASRLPARSVRAQADTRKSSRGWRQRLDQVMHYPDRDTAITFVDEVARPALVNVAEELRSRGADASISERYVGDVGINQVGLTVGAGENQVFEYRIRPRMAPTPPLATGTPHETPHETPQEIPRAEPETPDDSTPLPNGAGNAHYRLEVHLAEDNQAYDVLGCDQEEIIGDILDQYERHLEYLRMQSERAGNG